MQDTSQHQPSVRPGAVHSVFRILRSNMGFQNHGVLVGQPSCCRETVTAPQSLIARCTDIQSRAHNLAMTKYQLIMASCSLAVAILDMLYPASRKHRSRSYPVQSATQQLHEVALTVLRRFGANQGNIATPDFILISALMTVRISLTN